MRDQGKGDFEGILLIDKSMGCTSHDVVDRVRRVLKMKRIGHAGTLDPMATGLLVILVGKATKASQYIMSLDKKYEGNIFLGKSTDTQDAEGKVLEEKPVPELSEEKLVELMNEFKGDQYQTPPMFSAKKINGQPLYKLARKGKTIEREARVVHIANFKISEMGLPEFGFMVSCSKGTYVRTLANDLGDKIGCGAHLSALRRTEIGKFSVANSVTTDRLKEMTHKEIEDHLIPVHQAVQGLVL